MLIQKDAQDQNLQNDKSDLVNFSTDEYDLDFPLRIWFWHKGVFNTGPETFVSIITGDGVGPAFTMTREETIVFAQELLKRAGELEP
jgi:hypothetical protein